MLDVTALGELLVDFAGLSTDMDGYPTLAAHPGGAPANFLAALSKYGLSTAMIAKVGNDAFGHMLKKTMQKAGIETRGILVDDRVFTTLAFVTLDANGDREFSFARKPGADTCLSFEEFDLALIEEAKIIHFGTLSLTDEPARTATRKAISYAKGKGKIISFDPNLRKLLWSDIEEARKQMLYGLSMADIVKISEDEVEFLFGTDPNTGAKYLMETFGIKIVFVTMGKRGCYFQNKTACGYIDNIDAGSKTVDTTGAGDIFGGSALYGILLKNKTLEDLTEMELREIGTFACAAASLSTTRFGGISSVPEEIEVRRLINRIGE